MSANVLMISEQSFKDFTVASANIDLKMAMQYKFVNKGVVKRKSENITEPTFAELQSISQYYKGYAEWYAERAINYLCANSEQYPEYLNPGSDVTTIQPVSNQYKVAINLGRGDYEDHRPYSERYQGNRYKKPF